MAASSPATKRARLAPRVVHSQREDYDVYIGRRNKRVPEGVCGADGRWGNPFAISATVPRDVAIEKFAHWLLTDHAGQRMFADARAQLRNKTLGCWCAPQACHGDVLLEIANSEFLCLGKPPATESGE